MAPEWYMWGKVKFNSLMILNGGLFSIWTKMIYWTCDLFLSNLHSIFGKGLTNLSYSKPEANETNQLWCIEQKITKTSWFDVLLRHFSCFGPTSFMNQKFVIFKVIKSLKPGLILKRDYKTSNEKSDISIKESVLIKYPSIIN